jgi:hypothetical protein
MLFDA